MSLDDEIEGLMSRLEKIGLENKEERVCYIALRYLGSGSAEEIARKAARVGLNMSKSRAYAALSRLYDKRLIQKTRTRPATYVFFQNPLAQLESWAHSNVHNFEKRVNEAISQIAEFLEKEKHRAQLAIGLINIIGIGPEKKLETAMTLRTRRVFQRARNSIDIMTSRFHWVNKVEFDLRKALETEVTTVRVLLSEGNLRKKTKYGKTLEELARDYPDHFQLFDYNPGTLRLSMVDDSEAIVVLRSIKSKNIAVFHADNEDFVKELLVPSFQNHLENAKKIDI